MTESRSDDFLIHGVHQQEPLMNIIHPLSVQHATPLTYDHNHKHDDERDNEEKEHKEGYDSRTFIN